MLTRTIVAIVSASIRFPWIILGLSLFLSGAAARYAYEHFAITTDTSGLVSPHLPWRQREIQLDTAFPQQADTIAIVVDGATPELAERGAHTLAAELAKLPTQFQSVRRPDGGPFFDRNALLFLSVDDLKKTSEQLIRAQPFLGTLAADPTLAGLARALSFIPAGIAEGRAAFADFEKPLSKFADAIETAAAGGRADVSWSELMTGETPSRRELRRFVFVKPLLDYSALEPGAAASAKIRAIARAQGFTPEAGVTVRLTGPVPMADEEFATVAEGALLNAAVTAAIVVAILWLALRSGRIILAVVVSLVAGLVLTAATGLALVGALNVISIAFAVLFVGIGVDFGIQFAVRYREERHKRDDLSAALRAAAAEAGKPLALAAAATAAGFYAFVPTDYRGVSELGLISGTGMLIAFATSITLLPALLAILKPRGEAREVGYRALAPVDRFLARNRRAVLLITVLAVAAGLPLLQKIRFDFNPLNLRSAKVESVSTMLDLMRDPETVLDTVNILAPSLGDARVRAARLEQLPEVARTLTLDSFVPEDQPEKLAIVADAAGLLLPTLAAADPASKPTAQETTDALTAAADAYTKMSASGPERARADRLAHALTKLAQMEPARRAEVEAGLMQGFALRLDQIREALRAGPVTLSSLPPDLTRDWLTPDGRALIEVTPKGDANDNATLERFVAAVETVAPDATGRPILIQESANVVVRAFIQAACLALISITIILLVVLRRVSDVLLTLVPLLLAAVVTMELTVLVGLPLNFANIIALPLLLGVGVSFKIYYVLAWRGGETSLLASPLTRAVMFSAMTTATAFGSLWLSNHPGTSSMGELLSLSLVTTLVAAVFFQPILMGPPRQSAAPEKAEAMKVS